MTNQNLIPSCLASVNDLLLFYVIGVEYTCYFTPFHCYSGLQLCKCFVLIHDFPFPTFMPLDMYPCPHSQNSNFECDAILLSSMDNIF